MQMLVKFIAYTFIILFFSSQKYTVAQTVYDPLLPPNTYQHADNPYYWKNRKPYEGYWQQDIHYDIKANIDEKTDIIDGQLTLTYWNNSPDTLYEAFFHLYQNAFQPGSYYHQLYEGNGQDPEFGKYEVQGLGTVILNLNMNGRDATYETDNTIMRVKLPQPIPPNSEAQFDIKFKTYYDTGEMRRRMKVFNAYGYKHYDGVHWYPRISVYDRKFGWTTDQHLGREFYSDFGAYDVELTFANNFVVEATGNLLNRDEVLPPDLREKLDIRNFKDKPLEEKPSIVIPLDSIQRKTWKYHAENVHSFAFTADPTYRIGEASWNGIQCIALVQEPHAANWQEVADFTAQLIEVYSRDFGMYGYPKMVVADARDGMEYPMLTLCGGLQPGNRGLIAHEVGHNWFFGMIGNNETYRAALDEGFTQFLTAWSLEAIDGPYIKSDPIKNGYRRKFTDPTEVRFTRVYYGYLADAMKEEDPPLNTHSDAFSGAIRHGGGYRHVYYKTATMLYNLQYVLGDELFLKAMQGYFNQWKFCHPYLIDLRNSFIQSTGVDLNWFFDQWLETSKNIDYSVKSVKRSGRKNGQYSYDIRLSRKGRMQMPIDFSVVTKDGDTLDYYIPNTWFQKETDATVLPKWHGWDKLQPTYTASITTPSRIKNVIIDPSHRLADINKLNNSSTPTVDWSFDSKVANWPNWRQYEMNWRPDIWYNDYDGFKIGAHFNGNYMRYRNRFHFTFWYNTGLLQEAYSGYELPDTLSSRHNPVSFNLSWESGLDKWVRGSSLQLKAKGLDGLHSYSIKLKKDLPKNSRFAIELKSMIRPRDEDVLYLLYPGEWNAGQFNNTVNLEFKHQYQYGKGKGSMELGMRSSSLLSDYDYHYIDWAQINHSPIWKLELHSRFYARYGTGSNQASESALFLAGANNEELMDYNLLRSVGFVPDDWTNSGLYSPATANLQQAGGLNLRGYAGYLVLEDKDGVQYQLYKGQSGAALNLELDFDGLFKIRPKGLRDVFHLDTYFFGDAGTMLYKTVANEDAFSTIRMDGGVGAALTIKKFPPLDRVKPLTIRVDFPLFLSHTPYLEPDNFQFRWVIGIERSF